MKTAVKAIALILALPLGIGLWYAWTTGAFVGASDVYVADPAASVRDARQLMEGFRASAPLEERNQFLRPEQLPGSLRFPKLRYAQVFRDHVNLVLGRNPDWSIGARIWSADTTTLHADQPTAYREIFFFQYCNDVPMSPKNLP